MTSTLDRERVRAAGERHKATGISLAADSVTKSDRPSRHRGYVTRWRLRNRDKAVTLRNRLQRAFDENSATVAPAALKQLTMQIGETSDGKVI